MHCIHSVATYPVALSFIVECIKMLFLSVDVVAEVCTSVEVSFCFSIAVGNAVSACTVSASKSNNHKQISIS